MKTKEEMFPELREESEDERIRKAIYNALRYLETELSWDFVDDVDILDVYAWLEKQGEQKSMKTCAEYYNQDNKLKMPELSEFQNKLADILMYREYDGPDETEDDIAKGRLEYELAAIRLSEELLPLAQKEQKPAVIIPKFRIGDEIKTTNEEPLTITKIDEKGYWSEDLFICDFNNADNYELVEQKPTWSEEDDKMLNDILMCGERHCYLDAGNIAWLKSLRPQNNITYV